MSSDYLAHMYVASFLSDACHFFLKIQQPVSRFYMLVNRPGL